MNYTCRKVHISELQPGQIIYYDYPRRCKIFLNSYIEAFEENQVTPRITTLVVLRGSGIVQEHFYSDTVLDVLL